MAHILELAYGGSCKQVGLYDKTIKTLAMGLYYFYIKSLLNRTNLRRAAEAATINEYGIDPLNIRSSRTGGDLITETPDPGDAAENNVTADATKNNVLMPTRPGGTRWLQHTNKALSNILRSFHYLVLHMTQARILIYLYYKVKF